MLVVEDTENIVSAADRQAVDEVLYGTEYTVGQYLNIYMIKLINGQIVGKITEISSPISITIEIPELLRKEDRAFDIVRISGGRAEIIECTGNNPCIITIAVDKFSAYAIVYRDTKSADSDNPNMSATMPDKTIAFVCAIGAAAVTVRKRR